MIEFLITTITLLSIIYFLSLHFLESGLKKLGNFSQAKLSEQKKHVTVIISSRNEEKNIPALIDCLSTQEISDIDLEFILVNDRSEDLTGQLIDDQSQKDNRFKYLKIDKRVPGFAPKKYAIDQAIKMAKGEIIILTDADGRPGKEWVQTIASYFQNGTDMLIGYAPYKVSANAPIIKKVLALEYFSLASIAAATTGLGFPLTCVGTNMAYRKSVYQEIDGFGEFEPFISGDDDLFLTRVRENGNYKIHYAIDEKCHVFNAPPNSLKQFINQRLRYASKGFVYPIKVTAGLIVYVLFNLFLLAGLVYGLLNFGLVLWITFFAFSLKSIGEYKFVRKAATRLNDRRFINYYFITSLFHVPYILFFGIFGQLKIFRWAEKSAEHGVVK